MIKNFITSHYKPIKIVIITIISPIVVYIATSMMNVIFTIGNYVGTFLRGVYTYFVC